MRPEETIAAPALPLSGVRVLDLTQIYNGPYATFLMAMAGADIVKIEPPGGELLRRRDPGSGSGVPFAMLNANKRSLVLDLKAEEGREIFLTLVAGADVVAENYTPGVMGRLGLNFETLRQVNPRLIYASSSGYGHDGPYRDYPAMDLTVQAMSGIMSTTGFEDRPPVKSGAAICDFSGGVHLYGAIATALYQRERTGGGSRVDVSMLEAVYPTLSSSIGMLYGERDDIPSRVGNRHGGLSLCPYSVYPTRDGHVAIICSKEKHWLAIVRAMNRPDLKEDPRTATARERVRNMAFVDRLISDWTMTFTRDELFTHLVAANVPSAPVRELPEVLKDPHLHERGMLFEVEHPHYGTITVCRSPIDHVGQGQAAYRICSPVGADAISVLGEIGLDAAAVEALRQKQII